jgi:hypothetical protein
MSGSELSDCEIPDISTGAGETLRSFHWVTLYDDWDDGIRRILTVLQPESEGEPLDNHQQNTYADEDIIGLIPYSLTNALNDRKRERIVDRFSLVQGDYSTREYTRQEIDKLTTTQRKKLFTADPEMEAWWRGRATENGTWPLFRLKGGIWLSKDQIGQTPAEHGDTVWKIPGLLDWYMEDLVF